MRIFCRTPKFGMCTSSYHYPVIGISRGLGFSGLSCAMDVRGAFDVCISIVHWKYGHIPVRLNLYEVFMSLWLLISNRFFICFYENDTVHKHGLLAVRDVGVSTASI